MANKYIELRVNREFGDILSVYFEFIRQNLKKFTNVFLGYNGVFLIALLICSYLMVSGFIGMITHGSDTYGMEAGHWGNYGQIWFFIGAVGLYLLVMLVVVCFNYALSSFYLECYQGAKGQDFSNREVWRHCRDNMGKTLLFILLLVPIFLGVFIVAMIFILIPILGMFAQYILQFFVTAWIGVSFFAMISQKLGVIESFREGWRLVFANFWRSVGVNFILGLLNGLLMMVILIAPGIILGIYTFHVVENNVDVANSVVATIVYTLGLCSLLVFMVYAQCLSQMVNGILYYALHEKTYNLNARSKIDQIGRTEQ